MRRYLGPGKGDGRGRAPWEADRSAPREKRSRRPAPPEPETTANGTPLSLEGQAPPLSREQKESFWDLPRVDSAPRHAQSDRFPPIDHSLSGDGDEFDPATGWTFGGLESDPLLAPVDVPGEAPPLATADELFGPEATGGHAVVASPPPPRPAPPPQAAPKPAPPPKPRPRGLEVPSHSGPSSPLAKAAAQMHEAIRTSTEIEIMEDDDLVTDGHEAVPPPAPSAPAPEPEPLPDDVDVLLARGRELLSASKDAEAVVVLRRAQRLQPSNTVVQTWRELGERRLLQKYCGGAKPDTAPRLTGHRLDFWEAATELERQLLVAIDGKRTIGRLLSAAPDDKLLFLLEMLGRFGERGWVSWTG